jgi:urease accessory protein
MWRSGAGLAGGVRKGEHARAKETPMTRLAMLLAILPLPAFAHHPTGGMTPSSLWEGLASGIGHPVIGLDHLAFLVAAGVLAATLPMRGAVAAILAFVAGGFLGSLLHLAGIGLGPVEVVVAASVLGVGLALLWQRAPAWLVPAGFGLAGLFHGHAFAETVIGAEQGVLVAYLAALALTQTGIAVLVMLPARRLGARLPRLREVTGACAAVMGGLFLAMALVA